MKPSNPRALARVWDHPCGPRSRSRFPCAQPDGQRAAAASTGLQGGLAAPVPLAGCVLAEPHVCAPGPRMAGDPIPTGAPRPRPSALRAPQAETFEDQDRFLKEAAQSVKKNAYFMRKAMDEDNLREALRYSAAMLGELRTSYLSPQKYYELYMQVFDELGNLEVGSGGRARCAQPAGMARARPWELAAPCWRSAARAAAGACVPGPLRLPRRCERTPRRAAATPCAADLLRRRAQQGPRLQRAVRAGAARRQRAATPVSRPSPLPPPPPPPGGQRALASSRHRAPPPLPRRGRGGGRGVQAAWGRPASAAMQCSAVQGRAGTATTRHPPPPPSGTKRARRVRRQPSMPTPASCPGMQTAASRRCRYLMVAVGCQYIRSKEIAAPDILKVPSGLSRSCIRTSAAPACPLQIGAPPLPASHGPCGITHASGGARAVEGCVQAGHVLAQCLAPPPSPPLVPAPLTAAPPPAPPSPPPCQDLVEMTKGVQHPTRGLFLRSFLCQVSSRPCHPPSVPASSLVAPKHPRSPWALGLRGAHSSRLPPQPC